MRGKSTYGGRPGQRVEEQGTWASQKHSEAGYGRPVDRGVWTAKTVKRPRQQPAIPQYANYWAPLTRKRHTMPHSAQPQHTNYWAPRTRKRHQQEHRPQRPTERSDPTQHAKGRTGDCSGPVKKQQPEGMSHGGGSVQFWTPTPQRGQGVRRAGGRLNCSRVLRTFLSSLFHSKHFAPTQIRGVNSPFTIHHKGGEDGGENSVPRPSEAKNIVWAPL